MTDDDFTARARAQAKELQERIAQALRESDTLRETLIAQAKHSADLANEQTKAGLDALESAMKTGSETLARFMRGES
jgi:2-oxo-4-hydroxy-4-carboxy--5-ureidoimidazoline (OHCU) decarboxylase